LKREIGEVFLERTQRTGLKVDISMDDEAVLRGHEWYRFLSQCRAVLGCESGASLLDPSGQIRRKVEEYVQDKPKVTFDEVERECFPGQDYNIRLFTLSPRHFECAITRTCQVLLEGDYAGILSPGVHYIEVKSDYSNIDEVIELLHDADYCGQIADNAYRDIVLSGKYTYRAFANHVVDLIAERVEGSEEKTSMGDSHCLLLSRYLSFREYAEPILVKLFYVWLGIKLYRTKLFKKIWNRRHEI
jgi:hypothetical protein